MRTASIIAAINALKAADARLGNAAQDGWKQGDTLLATDCFSAASRLEAELIAHFPNAPVKEAA